MTNDEALALVRTALITATPSRQAEMANAKPQTALADLKLDSLSLLETIGLVEDALGGVEIPDNHLNRLKSVQDIMTLAIEKSP